MDLVSLEKSQESVAPWKPIEENVSRKKAQVIMSNVPSISNKMKIKN